MTGRAVEEWIGKTPDTPVPARVKLRVFERYDGRCYLSGRKIMPGDAWEVEHVRALSLGGENRESNLAPALIEHHREKTKAEVRAIRKADRARKKHLGLAKARGRRLTHPTLKKRFDGTVVPREPRA